MKTQTVFMLLACLGLVSVVTSQQMYCGRRLATALDVICDGNLVKRSKVRHINFEPTWPWIEATRAHELGYRRKRNVVSECCEKPCTVEELSSYCNF